MLFSFADTVQNWGGSTKKPMRHTDDAPDAKTDTRSAVHGGLPLPHNARPAFSAVYTLVHDTSR